MEENKSILIIKTEKNIIKCNSDSYFYITKENTIEAIERIKKAGLVN